MRERRGVRFVLLAVLTFGVVALFGLTPAGAADDRSANAADDRSADGRPAPVIGQDFESQVIEGSYIVVMKADPGAIGAASANTSAISKVESMGGEIGFSYSAALVGFEAKLTDEAVAALEADPAVDYVTPNGTVSISDVQDGATWGLDRIDQRGATLDGQYNFDQTGQGVDVYIIDTGINTTHVDFGGRVVEHINFTADGNNSDCNGHGTHVAGTVGGQTWGVAKNVTLYGVKVLDCSGSGSFDGVIAGMDWVAARATGPSVANMSLGGGTTPSVDQAADNMVAAGVTTAAAAGNNNGDACDFSPARAQNVITVASSAQGDSRSSFSNWGTCVEVFAPGSNITSAWIGNNTATNTISGTSMASPHVAGVAALYLQANPSAAPAAVGAAIVNDGTVGVITDPAGSPNVLLHSILGPPPEPTPFEVSLLPTVALEGSSASLSVAVVDPFLQAVTINYTVTDDTGTRADDTTLAASGSVVIGPDNSDNSQFTLADFNVINDGVDEGQEQLNVSITMVDPSGLGTIGTANATVTLIDEGQVQVIDNFETDQGWQRSASDTATTGFWAVGTPQQTQVLDGNIYQLGTTPSGTGALVTGLVSDPAGVGFDDVDGGLTTSLSPPIVLSEEALFLGYDFVFAHYTNADTGDFFAVDLLDATGTQVLETLQRIDAAAGQDRPAAWSQVRIPIAQYAGQTVRVRFSAADANAPSLVEAAADDLVVINGEEEPPPPPPPPVDAVIGGTVTDDGAPVAGLGVDLFGSNEAGERLEFLEFTATDGNGEFSFELDPGCYVLTFIASDGRVFTTGNQWLNTLSCVEAGEVDDTNNAQLRPEGGLPSAVGGQVSFTDGTPVPNPSVELFTVNADGTRGTWQRSAIGEINGSYSFEVEPGCYNITFLAPEGENFINNQPWFNAAGCVAEGETLDDLNATVAIAGSQATITASVVDLAGAPVAGVNVDVFTENADGSRGTYVTSMSTGDDGAIAASIAPGCHWAIYVAPEGDLFQNGTGYAERQGICAEAGETVAATVATLDR